MQQFIKILIKTKSKPLTRFKDQLEEILKQINRKHDKRIFERLIDYDKKLVSVSKDSLENKLLFEPGSGKSVFSLKALETTSAASLLICADHSAKKLHDLKAISETRTKKPVDYVLCDCINSPFRDNVFDVIIDNGFLDHLKKEYPEFMLQALEDLLYKLNYGGNNVNENTIGYLVHVTDRLPQAEKLFFKLFLKAFKFDDFKIEFNWKEIYLNDEDDNVYFIYFFYKFKREKTFLERLFSS